MSRATLLRFMGLVPIVLFGLYFLSSYRLGTAANSLWMCHVSNLFLGFGLWAGSGWLIRVSALWLIIGFPLWLYDALQTGVWSIESTAVHVIGLGLSIAVLRMVGASRMTWLTAFLMFLLLQQICRWLLPPNLNVNLAHAVRPEWSWAFSSYVTYWWFTSGLLLVSLALTNRLLVRIFPESKKDR